MGRPPRSLWRAWLSAVPSALALRGAGSATPGTWLYVQSTAGWLRDPALRSQLPWSLRWFGRLAALRPGNPLALETVLRALMFLRRSLGRRHIARLVVDGATIHLDLRDPRFLAVPGELRTVPPLLARFLGRGDSVLDVGANHGAYAVAGSRLVGAEGWVLAVEPQPRLAEAVRLSLAEAPASFEVHRVVCGDRDREVDFHVPRATSGSAGIFPGFSGSTPHRRSAERMRPLDDIVDPDRLRGRLFVKLDVEGSEVLVLKGARRTIATHRPVILTEVNPESLSAAGESPRTLIATLRELGYDRYLTRRETDGERPLEGEIRDADIIALPAVL